MLKLYFILTQIAVKQAQTILDGAPVEACHFFHYPLIDTAIYFQKSGDDWFWYNPHSKEWQIDYDRDDKHSLSELKNFLQKTQS